MKKFEVLTCIDDDEVKCSCSVRICNTCDYQTLFNCQPATVLAEVPEEKENEQ